MKLITEHNVRREAIPTEKLKSLEIWGGSDRDGAEPGLLKSLSKAAKSAHHRPIQTMNFEERWRSYAKLGIVPNRIAVDSVLL